MTRTYSCMDFLFNVRVLPLIILACIIVSSGCKKKESDPETPVVNVPIGIVFSFTGNFGPYGIIQQNGATLAINEINANSFIPGIRLVPYIVDDKSVPDTCRNIFRELISVKKVLAIIGPTSSNSAFVADTVAQNRGVVVMGISNTVSGITEMGNFIFRNCLPETVVIPNTIRVTHEKLGYSKVSIIYGNDDPYTVGAYESFRTALENTPGITIVSTDTVHKGDNKFTDQLNRVKAANPDVIVLAVLVNEASQIMVQAKNLGFPDSIRFIGGNSFNTSKLWQQAGTAAQGAICGSAWIHTENTPGNAQFIDNYVSHYGSTPDQFAAQAYASIYIIADALKRSSVISSDELRASLANTSNLETILGTFSFDTLRNPVHPPVVQELVDGEFVLFQ